MDEQMNTNGGSVPTPKEAAKNLLKSVQTPLIWFGLGIAATLIFQARQKKSGV